jgi:hypothetical protein
MEFCRGGSGKASEVKNLVRIAKSEYQPARNCTTPELLELLNS